MKKFLNKFCEVGLAFAFIAGIAVFLSDPPLHAQIGSPNQIQCNQFASQNASSTTNASLQAGSSGKSINICGWHVTSSSSTSTSFQFSYTLTANCAGVTTAVTPPFNVTQNAPATDHIEFASLSLPSGAGLCSISSTNSLQIGVWFSQQ